MSDLPTSLMTADDLSVSSMFGGPQWGIFNQNGTHILATNSVLNVEYARDFRISDYPQEKGGFQSYNKVKAPFQAKITFIIADTRSEFLNNIERAIASLAFVTIITPEVQYPSANLTHYDYRRQKENASFIAVSVWCEEVRIAGQTQLTDSDVGPASTNKPSGSGGTVSVEFPNVGESTQSTNGASTSQNGAVSVFDLPAAEAARLEPPL